MSELLHFRETTDRRVEIMCGIAISILIFIMGINFFTLSTDLCT